MNHPPLILVSSGTVPDPLSRRRRLSVLYGDALTKTGLLSVCALGGDAQALAARFDGLLLSGGGDMTASLFGQEKHPLAGEPDAVRDREELDLIHAFCAESKPIFGICRGMQVLNVYFGGDLIQHIDGHDSSPHAVHTVPESLIGTLCGPAFTANSFHHQAIGQAGSGLRVTAYAADGTAEAVEHDTLPVYGVQWHPERMVAGVCMDTAADHTALFAQLGAHT